MTLAELILKMKKSFYPLPFMKKQIIKKFKELFQNEPKIKNLEQNKKAMFMLIEFIRIQNNEEPRKWSTSSQELKCMACCL